MDSYRFKSCWVHVKHEERWIGTVFPDGTTAHARPCYSEEDLARAEALGYPRTNDGVWTMSIDHELMHTAMAEMAGEGRSEVLWRAAHGSLKFIDVEHAMTEECRVLDAQKRRPPALMAYIGRAKQRTGEG